MKHLGIDASVPERLDEMSQCSERYSLEEVEAYLLGQTEPTEAETLESHYLGCPACLDRLEEAMVVIDEMRTALVIRPANAA